MFARGWLDQELPLLEVGFATIGRLETDASVRDQILVGSHLDQEPTRAFADLAFNDFPVDQYEQAGLGFAIGNNLFTGRGRNLAWSRLRENEVWLGNQENDPNAPAVQWAGSRMMAGGVGTLIQHEIRGGQGSNGEPQEGAGE